MTTENQGQRGAASLVTVAEPHPIPPRKGEGEMEPRGRGGSKR